jgi:hypothetical protein
MPARGAGNAAVAGRSDDESFHSFLTSLAISRQVRNST